MFSDMLGVFVILVFLAVYVINYYKKVSQYPPGPLPLPFIGNIHQLQVENTHLQLDEMGRRYGECFTLFLPTPTVVMTDYAHIREALITQGETFAGRSHLPPETLLQKRPNTGVLISDGDTWREQRRTALKILRNFGLGKGLMEQQVRGSIEEMLVQIEDMDKNDVDLFLPLQLCVGNIINETLFGYHYNYKDCAKFEHFVRVVGIHFDLIKSSAFVYLIQAFPWMRHLPVIGYLGCGKIEENMDVYRAFIEDEIRKQVSTFDANDEPKTFVHAYLQEAEQTRQKGDTTLDMDNLTASCVDFWMAGMETTSTTLRWAMKYMVKYPDVQDKVRAEVDAVIGQDRTPEMRDKVDMPYTMAVIAEIQRCCNMVCFLGPHRATDDALVLGKKIPKNTICMPQIWSVLDRDTTFEDPKVFRPERFLSTDGKTLDKTQLDRMIAFGAGRRQCLGEGLARQELFLVFTTLLQRYEFVATTPLDMTPIFSTVMLPKPYRVKITSRV